jgi:ATP-binding cassette, subfamily B, multidrug efflux pump
MNRELLRALGYLRAYRFLLLGAGICLVISVAATVAVPQVMRAIINDIVSATRQQQFGLIGALSILGLGLVRSLASYIQAYLIQRAGEGLGFELRQILLRKLDQLGFSYHNRADSGQLITLMTSDVDLVAAAGNGVGVIIYSALVTLTTAVILFIMNWQLAVITLIILPPIAYLMFRFQKLTPPLFRNSQMRAGMLVSVLQEVIINMRIVRVFGREPYQLERFRTAVQGTFDATMQVMRLLSRFIPIIQLFALAATAIVIGVGGYQVIGGSLSLGELVAFSNYVSILVAPIFTVVSVISTLTRASASAKRLYEVLDVPLDLTDRPGAQALPPVQGRVSYEEVAFHFPDANTAAVQGITFTAEPGHFVVVLGPTGSGKSAMMNLLPRFYDVSAGRVSVDGHDVRDVTLQSLRSQIAIAPQTTLLFSGTIRDNIAFGRPGAELDEVREAARLAQADKFIEALPLGYDTPLGESGAGLSGGQQQRIALARALLLRPPILILDDSMSGLDADTKQQFVRALRALPWVCTRFVLGEQVGTVEEADLILVMDKGQIVARGRHQELLRSNPIYSNLLTPQGALEVATA